MRTLKNWMKTIIESMTYEEMEAISFGMSSNSSVGSIGVMTHMLTNIGINTSKMFTDEDEELY